MKTLEYYSESGEYFVCNKYTIDTAGIIRNTNTGKVLKSSLIGKYHNVTIQTATGRRAVRINRAVASSFLGKPPTSSHTADHIDRNTNNNCLENIRWLCKSGQINNQKRPEVYKSVFIIVKNGEEKTVKEWAAKEKVCESTIFNYIQSQKNGYAYKEYSDLEGELWKPIEGSENSHGRWEISNINRVKYITKHATNVLWGERLCINEQGYPIIYINKKNMKCHILAFRAFYPDLWEAKDPDEIVLHKHDDKKDFRPENLRLGTQKENIKDAHDNDKYAGKSSMRMRCASYINGVLEKEHVSQNDAVMYLRSKGLPRAKQGGISNALTGKCKIAYGRTWTKVYPEFDN